MRIFISYSHRDRKFVERLARRLQRYHEVWYDESLRAGSEWWNIILQKLGWCECFIYILSAESLSSEYCQRELAEARRLKKQLVPVCLNNALKLPDDLTPIHYADFATRPFDAALADLIGDLGLLPHSGSAPASTVGKEDPRTLNVLETLPAPFEWCEVPENPAFMMQTDEGDMGSFSIAAFLIAKYPITYAQFQVFVTAADGFPNNTWWQGLAADEKHRSRSGEQSFKYNNHPRESVSWFDSVAFCRWLSARVEREIRLPTEWEWQWAAQGIDGRAYPWGDQYISTYANVDETKDGTGPYCREKTSAVGEYAHNISPFGVMDMSGNVWEWCLNEYRTLRSTTLEGEAERSVRGGSWLNGVRSARVDHRNCRYPYHRYPYGFRIITVV